MADFCEDGDEPRFHSTDSVPWDSLSFNLDYASQRSESLLKKDEDKTFLFYTSCYMKRAEACKHYCYEECLFDFLNTLVIVFQSSRFV